MNKSFLKSALVGGLVAFMWTIFLWTVIGWPAQTFKTFHSEQKVATVIRENATESGVYLLPNPYSTSSNFQAAQKNHIFKTGPVVFAAVQVKGLNGMIWSIVLGYLSNVVAAYCLAWGLFQARGLLYFQKVTFVTVLGGVIACMLGILPDYLWKAYPGDYVLYCMLETVSAWFLAGLVMAKMTGRHNESIVKVHKTTKVRSSKA